jgi:glycine cleavage system regulatory protein
VVAERGGSWQHSEMARLAGKFAGIVLVDVPGEEVDALRAALEGLGGVAGLAVTMTAADPDGSAAHHTLTLHLIGQDRPGIVQQVSRALAGHGVSIEELHTATRAAPMSGGLLFEARALLRVPDGVAADAVRPDLEDIAHELMVDIDLT